MDPIPPPEKEAATNRWTEDKEQKLLMSVKDGPLKPDWKTISEDIGMTESTCIHKYTELVSPEQQLRDSSDKISLDDIRQLLSEKLVECMTCKDVLYIPLCEWRGIRECPKCYKGHESEVNTIWKSIDPHLHCRFCKRERGDGIPLHFDHINMFEKGDSICMMVSRGDTPENILCEIQKCQVLCKSCHAVVTDVENLIGSRRAKTNLTRSINGTLKGGEILTPEMAAEIHLRYKDLYTQTMEPLYPLIMQLVGAKVTESA